MKKEQILALQVSRFISMQFPDVIYRFDLAADLNLTIGQAKRNKSLNTDRGYPDLFIAEPRLIDGVQYAGLFIELKATTPFKKNGELKKQKRKDGTDHLQDQADMLETLRSKGYQAQFATGFDETEKLIRNYLSDKKKRTEVNDEVF